LGGVIKGGGALVIFCSFEEGEKPATQKTFLWEKGGGGRLFQKHVLPMIY